MPDKQPNTDGRHGGPGSSHENAAKPHAEPHRSGSGGRDDNAPPPGETSSPDRSQVSGGGGERDKHHMHDPRTKS